MYAWAELDTQVIQVIAILTNDSFQHLLSTSCFASSSLQRMSLYRNKLSDSINKINGAYSSLFAR